MIQDNLSFKLRDRFENENGEALKEIAKKFDAQVTAVLTCPGKEAKVETKGEKYSRVDRWHLGIHLLVPRENRKKLRKAVRKYIKKFNRMTQFYNKL